MSPYEVPDWKKHEALRTQWLANQHWNKFWPADPSCIRIASGSSHSVVIVWPEDLRVEMNHYEEP